MGSRDPLRVRINRPNGYGRHKDAMRKLVHAWLSLVGGRTPRHFGLLRNYVTALRKLLVAILPHLDLGRALRGRYMAAVAEMEDLWSAHRHASPGSANRLLGGDPGSARCHNPEYDYVYAGRH